MKGITPIISIIILLIIVIALAGFAYTYFTNYFALRTSKTIEIVESYCDNGEAKIIIKNIGTETIDVPDGFTTDKYKDTNMVFFASFDNDDEANGVVKDDSGNGNDGDAFGPNRGTSIFWVRGKIKKGINLNGDDGPEDYINISDSSSLRPENITVMAWVKITSFRDVVIIDKQFKDTFDSYILYADEQGSDKFVPVFCAAETTTNNCISGQSVNISINKWHHIAGTYNVTEGISVYLDGKLANNRPSANPIQYSIQDVMLGVENQSPWLVRDFNGTMDYVTVFSRVLLPEEIEEYGEECEESVSAYKCKEIEVSKIGGNIEFSPVFEDKEIPPGKTATFKDIDCKGGCKYRIASPSNSVTAFVSC